jgi:Protein of unknown function (DUF3224)
MAHVTGEFNVKMVPLPEPEDAPETDIGRMSLDKTYYGPLKATAAGDFLSIMGNVQGSAGYVAMERVTGTLEGFSGSFALMHRGVMAPAGRELLITVVPDSGTDALTGLSGTMSITITDGKHFYDFEYDLPR